jgi:hypothetical protein
MLGGPFAHGHGWAAKNVWHIVSCTADIAHSTDKCFALTQHRHGVPGQKKCPIYAGQSKTERFGIVQIEVDNVFTFGAQSFNVRLSTRCNTNIDVVTVRKFLNRPQQHLTGPGLGISVSPSWKLFCEGSPLGLEERRIWRFFVGSRVSGVLVG